MNFNTLLYEKTLEESKVDKTIDQKEAEQLKPNYDRFNDKRRKIMDSTKIKVENIISDAILKDSISPEQITKLNNFSAKKI